MGKGGGKKVGKDKADPREKKEEERGKGENEDGKRGEGERAGRKNGRGKEAGNEGEQKKGMNAVLVFHQTEERREGKGGQRSAEKWNG